MTLDDASNKRVASVTRRLKLLTEEERLEVFADFCTWCGSDDPQCQCSNDD